MRFFVLLLLLLIALPIGGYIYHWLTRLTGCFRAGKPTGKVRLLLLALTVLLTIASANIPSMPALLLLHVWVFSAVTELAVWILKKCWKNRPPVPRALRLIFRCSVLPLLLGVALIVYGTYNMARVVETPYTLTTQKDIRPEGYRVVFLSDTHYGTIQDPAALRDAAARISESEPDLVILGGDIVEEGTTRAGMEEVFSVLGGIRSRYGVYYVYGNHDRQVYVREKAYTEEQLAQTIEKNGIRILRDECVELGDDLLLVGRFDAGYGNERASIAELLGGADRGRLILVADHQPVETAENGRAGVDIQLSGHTHAGQLFPIGVVGELFGNLIYGRYEREGCTLLLSSGVAGWGYAVRTYKHSEYMAVTIVPAEQ